MESLLTTDERSLAEAISAAAYCNPFLPERIEHERSALGQDFVEGTQPWNVHPDSLNQNLLQLQQRAEKLVETLLARLQEGKRLAKCDVAPYEDVVLFVLYHRFLPLFQELIGDQSAGATRPARRAVVFYRDFSADASRFFNHPSARQPSPNDLAHLFACFFQMRRAFDRIFECIIGVSQPTIRLRAQAWQSIFTHDLRRYRGTLYNRMGELTTLVTGPSGTGKELVARAIGLARYVPFDHESRRFREDSGGSFHPLNLSALSPMLIESELFGHRRGSFTGALNDHTGWMEVCSPAGTVFLDEIGEIEPEVQVKLLRVLENGSFQRIGDTTTIQFKGKIIAATNRDLAREMQAGRFREDLYYRLCSDLVTTPSLAARLRNDAGELDHLILYSARRLIGEDAPELAHEVRAWIDRHLGADYAWPGNVRELEQCVRNVLVRGEYHPTGADDDRPSNEHKSLADAIHEGRLTADELLDRYCASVYGQTKSYVETARRLGIDRRTVKMRIDRRAGA